MTVVNLSVWQASPGRAAELERAIVEARRICERLGARVSIWRTVVGGPADALAYTTEFDDVASFGAFTDRLEADERWRALWERVTAASSPTATVVGSVLVSEVDDL